MKMFYDSRDKSMNPSDMTSNVAESRNEGFSNIASQKGPKVMIGSTNQEF